MVSLGWALGAQPGLRGWQEGSPPTTPGCRAPPNTEQGKRGPAAAGLWAKLAQLPLGFSGVSAVLGEALLLSFLPWPETEKGKRDVKGR